MREILFRGKRTDNREWIYGYYFFENTNVFAKFNGCHYIHPCGQNQAISVIPETVGQYTGLTDKNGKKIFENGYMIIDNKTYKVTFNNAEYILTNIFNCDIITLKNNSIKGVFVDEI